MKSSLKMRLAVGVVSSASLQCHAFGRPAKILQPLRLCIHVHNPANASSRILDKATERAAETLTAAGVEIVWQFRPADEPGASMTDQHAASAQKHEPDLRDYLVIRILPRFPDYCLPGVLGYSLPDARFGPHVVLFFNRIERASLLNDVDVATVLGYAMAHEIGHVLLGSSEHSPGGIMKARWSMLDYENAAEGYMRFTPQQADVIRGRASIRLATQLR
jgi:hypothetical protein